MKNKGKKILTKENLIKYKDSGFLTVGNLIEFIKNNNIPNDAIIVAQRVEDVYYEKHNWGVYLKEGDISKMLRGFNESIDSGEFQKKYSDMPEDIKKKFTEEDILESMDEYHPILSPVLYKEDKNEILFLDLHY